LKRPVPRESLSSDATTLLPWFKSLFLINRQHVDG
jgi:hypothetical protein